MRIAQTLDEALVACANIGSMKRALPIRQGERGEAKEAGVLFKTNAELLELAVARRAQRQWSPKP